MIVPTTLIMYLLVAVVMYAVGALLLPSSGGQEYEEISRACREGLINDTEVCSQLPEGKSAWSPWCLLLAIAEGLAVWVYRCFTHAAPGRPYMAHRTRTTRKERCGVSNDTESYKCGKCGETNQTFPKTSEELRSGTFTNESLGSTGAASVVNASSVVSSTTEDAEKGPLRATERDVSEAIDDLLEILVKDDDHTKPLHILLVGKPGAGKSEFINSTAAALSRDKWEQFADSGRLPASQPITIRMTQHPRCCMKDRYKEYLLPTLTDDPGLSNEGGEAMTALLTLLLYGHIKDTTPVQTVYNHCKTLPLQDLRHKYRKSYYDMRVDRVIFVASCEDELPEELMKCVRNVVKPPHDSPQQKEIPLFCVLTMMDKVDLEDPEFQRKRERFKLLLGLDEPRLLVCSNYCDDVDRQKERLRRLRPDLDLPIVEFLQQVCSRARTPINEHERLEVPGLRYHINNILAAIGAVPTTVIMSFFVAVVAYAVGTLLLPSSGQDYEQMSRACREGLIKDTEVCSQLPEGKNQWSPWCLLLAIVAGLAVCVIRHARHRDI